MRSCMDLLLATFDWFAREVSGAFSPEAAAGSDEPPRYEQRVGFGNEGWHSTKSVCAFSTGSGHADPMLWFQRLDFQPNHFHVSVACDIHWKAAQIPADHFLNHRFPFRFRDAFGERQPGCADPPRQSF